MSSGARWFSSISPSGFSPAKLHPYNYEAMAISGHGIANPAGLPFFGINLSGINITALSAVMEVGATPHLPVPSRFVIASLPEPSVGISCTSMTGTATLCGFSEYIASVPPRKYLTKTGSGNIQSNYYPSGGCTGSPSLKLGNITGACNYDPNTCIVSGGMTYTLDGVVVASGCTFDSLFVTSCGRIVTDTATTKSTQADPALPCCPGGGAGGNKNLSENFLFALTNEDTEQDAIDRASKTPGTSCVSFREARAAGDFSLDFAEVSYQLNCADLVVGVSYSVTAQLLTEDYGGGNPSTQNLEWGFVASDITHTINDSIPLPASGKQAQLQNIAISFA